MAPEQRIARLEKTLGTLISWLHIIVLNSQDTHLLLKMLEEDTSRLNGVIASEGEK
jgi:hypothetical protein